MPQIPDKYEIRRAVRYRPDSGHRAALDGKREYTHTTKIATIESVNSPSYASRILQLMPLAPDVQESILFEELASRLTLS